nr:nucleic acid-binding, OB-fold protein [Tanacetum cinerariifolium]
MFNETATTLVKCSADSLMDTTDESAKDHLSLLPALSNLIGTVHVMEIKSHTYCEYGTFESFTCWQIHPMEGIKDSVGSNTVDAVPDNQPHNLKR